MQDDRYFKNHYAFWQDCLAGNVKSLSPQYADTGFCGYWKIQGGKSTKYSRLAIWPIDSGFLSKFNDSPAQKSSGLPNISGFAYAFAVSEDDYNYHKREGVWPGEVAGLSNSREITSSEHTIGELIEVSRVAELFLANIRGNVTQSTCDNAANLRDKINVLIKHAGSHRADELAPLALKASECKQRWDRVISPSATTANKLRTVVEEFLISSEAAAHNEMERKLSEIGKVDIALECIERERLTKKRNRPKVHAGGQIGRRMGLRTEYKATVVDFNLALKHFERNPKVIELVTKLASSSARSQHTRNVPGVRYDETRKAI
jgi:hypothetical protein